MMTIKQDDEAGQTGLWECPSCKSRFHGGGEALHASECKDSGYADCTFLVSAATIPAYIPNRFTAGQISGALSP